MNRHGKEASKNIVIFFLCFFSAVQLFLFAFIATDSDRRFSQHKINSSILSSEIDLIEKEVDRISSEVDHLFTTMVVEEEFHLRAIQTRDAIRASLPRKNYLPGCPDIPTLQEVDLMARALLKETERYSVPLTLALAVARQESAFCQAATSRVGARGIMQVMPSTADEMIKEFGTPMDINRHEDNISLGVLYLRKMIDEFQGNTDLAVRAYNAGPHNVRKVLVGSHSDYYPETKEYARAVASFRANFDSTILPSRKGSITKTGKEK